MQIAKVVGYQGEGEQHPIIHFYGEDAFVKGRQFPAMCEGNHPFSVLIGLNFYPVSETIWRKD